MKRSGEITVFLSMCLLCIWALLCVMLESARTAGSRFYFQVAAGSALDTLFSRYHRRLWEEYGIFALEYRTQEELILDLESYINEYLSIDNWYPIKLESVDVTQLTGIADKGGDYLAEEVLRFMKAGAAISLFVEPEEGEQFLKDVIEGASVHTLSGLYNNQERETRKLEQAVGKLLDNAQEQERISQEIGKNLIQNDERGFFRAAKDYRRNAEKYQKLMRQYEKQAKALADRQGQSRTKLNEAGADLQDNRQELFKQQWNPYDAYIAQDGERRKEFAGWESMLESNLELLSETEQMVENRRNKEEEMDEEEELHLAAAGEFWRDGYRKNSFIGKASCGDEQKKNLLDQVKRLCEGGLLEAVMPEGVKVSSAVFPAGDIPSQNISGEDIQKSGGKTGSSLPERVLVNEYCGYYFTDALSTDKHPIQYELEYLLQGAKTDRENLEETVTELFALREGMNLIHILSDAEKRQEAKALALVITGAAGLAPLTEIMAWVIMGVWAMGESIQDLRILMNGGKVPLWKQKSDWNTDLDNILNMGQGQMPDMNSSLGQQGDGKGGFSYEQYLKLLLLKETPQTKHMRMLDLIQMNMRWEQPGFSVENCAYGVDICGKACGKHLFFALPIVESFAGRQEGYPLEALGEKAY